MLRQIVMQLKQLKLTKAHNFIIVAKFQRDIIPKYNYNNLFTMKTSAK